MLQDILSARILAMTGNATENIRKLISPKCSFELIAGEGSGLTD